MNKINNSAIGKSWEEIEHELFTPEEILESDLRVNIIGELIKARQKKRDNTKKLEEITGVKQPVIARLEKGISTPQVSTLIKLLTPLGYKLSIVPIEEK